MTPINWQKKSDKDFHTTDFTDTLIRQAEQDQQTLRKPTSKFSKDIQYPINRVRLIHPLKTALIMFSVCFVMVKKKLVFLFIRVVKMSSNLWNFRATRNRANQKKQDQIISLIASDTFVGVASIPYIQGQGAKQGLEYIKKCITIKLSQGLSRVFFFQPLRQRTSKQSC